MIGSLPETGWKILVVDRYALSIISSACRVADLIQKSVTLVELLEKKREPLNSEALYFVSPTEESAREILMDVEKSKYRAFHVFFTSPASKGVIKILASSTNSKLIKTCTDFNLDFLAIETNVFTFRDGDDMKMSFFNSGDFEDYSKYLADRLMSFLQTVKELPVIRYNTEKGKNRDVSHQVAARLRDKINDFKKTSTLEFVKNQPKALLLIIDRSEDALTPLVTDLTYQALVQNRIGLDKGCIYTYTTTKDNKEVVKKAIFDDNDDIWFRHRAKHIVDVVNSLNKELKDFAEKNGMLRDKKELKLEEIGAMLRKLPEYNHIAMHKKLATRLLDMVKKDGILDVLKIQQDMLVDKDASGKPLKSIKDEILDVLKKPNVSQQDKLQLLMTHAVTKGDRELIEKAHQLVKFTDSEKLALTNINVVKPIGTFAPLKAIITTSTDKDIDPTLFRARPTVRQICDDVLKGTLSEKDYKYIDAPPSSWKIESVTTQKKNDYKLFVFVIGGMSYSELHHSYDLEKEYGIDIVFGATSLITTKDYLWKLSHTDDGIKKNFDEDVEDDELSI